MPQAGGSASEVLAPLWAEESLYRAHCMLRLIEMSERHSASRFEQIDVAVADELAAFHRALRAHPERVPAQCSNILRSMAGRLVKLFGAAAGGVDLHMSVERLSLPGYQRRALVLAALELMSSVLLCACEH